MIETQLYTVLSTDSAVSALVAVRIFPMRRPANILTLPAIVYQRVSTAPEVTLQGDAGLDSVRVQCSCWASTYGGAKALSTAVRAAVNASTLSAITEMELDDEDTVTGEYRVILDFRIWQ